MGYVLYPTNNGFLLSKFNMNIGIVLSSLILSILLIPIFKQLLNNY